MIFITGDAHARFGKFSAKQFSQGESLTRDDYVIICGDFGGIWAHDAGTDDAENARHEFLRSLPFTVLFVDGNHGNFNRLGGYPVETWHGGKVHIIYDNVIHLMRGQVFELEGKKIFTMGGAKSHDIRDGILDPEDPDFEFKHFMKYMKGEMFRVLNYSWWPQEMPSEAEYNEARANLEKCGYEVDYIVTHCCPTSIQQSLNKGFSPDELTDFLQWVKRMCKFKHWYFGHYHGQQDIGDNFHLLYNDIVPLAE